VSVSYKKLWKLLIDKDMTRTDLRMAVGASTSTFAKLSKDEYISCDLMARICQALECNIGDIMDVVLDEKPILKTN
jgi:putative transcriptional regulator